MVLLNLGVLLSALPLASVAYANDLSTYLLQAIQEEEGGQEAVTASPDTHQSDPMQAVGTPIEQIDQEIIILRAELAHSQNQPEQVSLYLNQLSAQRIFPAFKARYLALLDRQKAPQPKVTQIELPDYLSDEALNLPSKVGLEVVDTHIVKGLKIDYQNPSTVFAVLLPLSGDYEAAGKKVLNGITDAIKNQSIRAKVVVFDTEEYGSAWSLWQAVKVHQPSLVLGPLQKEQARAFQALKTQVPTLYFNQLSPLFAYERTLAPNKSAGLKAVFSILDSHENQNVLVLSDADEAFINLEKTFHQAWLNQYPDAHYVHQSLNDSKERETPGKVRASKLNVGQVLENGLNIHHSINRAKVLENIVETAIEFKPRPRQDFGAVVSLLPHNQAAQAAPFLSFLGAQKTKHIWYPGQMPNMALLANELQTWPKTYGVLPFYGAENARDALLALKNEDSGLFYALGRSAVEMVKYDVLSNPLAQSSQGLLDQVEMHQTSHFQLMPTVYWIDNGVFKVMPEAALYEESAKPAKENQE
ncbi:penicillin-binding protein activator [Thiomicrorhabdus aquaedulcis]|uniref:penicillin-binding protein activator n=1 Tax=Thiomicrorhabdus aquaedulcis TaxID=2211106 RepID=UPI0015627D4B|nr:penicillin-binding protein activator [Thiomicrorhabdus aquaedulcis]